MNRSARSFQGQLLLVTGMTLFSASAGVAQQEVVNPELLGSTREFEIRGELTSVQISPVNPDIISCESVESAQWRHLWWIARKEKKLHQISPRRVSDDLGAESDRELSWCPVKYHERVWYLYVSSGEEGNDDLYLGNLNDNVCARLTKHRSSDHHPRWSPDGNQIVFVSARTGNGDLYLIRNAGAIVEQFWQAVHPSGGLPGRDVAHSVIVDIPVDASAIRLTLNPDVDTFPDWSPDGRWIAYQANVSGDRSRNSEIFVLDPSQPGREPRKLTDSPAVDKSQPTWSADQEGIAYYSSPVSADPKAVDRVSLVYLPLIQPLHCASPVQSKEGPGVLDVSVRKCDNVGPAWCNGSRLLAFIEYRGRETPLCACPAKVPVAPGAAREIAVSGRQGPVQNMSLDIRKNGAQIRIAFVSYERQDYYLYVADLKSGGPIAAATTASTRAKSGQTGFGCELTLFPGFPSQRTNFSRAGGSVFEEFLREQSCISSIPVNYSLRLSLGIMQLPTTDVISTLIVYTELQARFGTEARIAGATVYPFIATGIGMVIAKEQNQGADDQHSVPGWPLGCGVSFSLLNNCDASLSLMRHSFAPEILKRGLPNDLPGSVFLGLHFDVVYRFRHQGVSGDE